MLGGGAARGFAHVGVIRVLEQEKIPIDMIVGTSVGSLIGAIYACDLNSFELEWTAFSLEKEHLFDFAMLSAFTSMGPVKGDRLEEFVRTKVAVANIENLKLPFAAVATDLNRGTRVVLDRGSDGPGSACKQRHPRRVQPRGVPGQTARRRRRGGQYPHIRGQGEGSRYRDRRGYQRERDEFQRHQSWWTSCSSP